MYMYSVCVCVCEMSFTELLPSVAARPHPRGI